MKLKFIFFSLFLAYITYGQQKSIIENSLHKNQGEARRIALLIGNNQYEPPIKSIPNVQNDIDSMRIVLHFLGFEIREIKNGKIEEINSFLTENISKITQNDVLFFYYSGHGVGHIGKNYIIPIDFKSICTNNLEKNALCIDDVQKAIEEKGVRNLFMVLDACREELFQSECPSKSLKGVGKLVPPSRNPVGHLLAFSADYGKTSTYLSLYGKNSLYTESLLIYLKKPLEVKQIFNLTNKRTYELSNTLHRKNPNIQIQRPVYTNKIYGDFYFLEKEIQIANKNQNSWNFGSGGIVKTNGPLGRRSLGIENDNKVFSENIIHGESEACFTNSNFYSRKIVLTHLETNQIYEEIVGQSNYSGPPNEACFMALPPGIYRYETFTTFTNYKTSSSQIKLNNGQKLVVKIAKDDKN